MTQNEYLVHYGVKGMKWGVRRDRRAANKARRRAEKEAYKREVDRPGSQSADKVSTKTLERKHALNLTAATFLGSTAISSAAALGMLGVSAAGAVAGGAPAIAVGQAVMPMALAQLGVGGASAAGTIYTANKTSRIQRSLTKRDDATPLRNPERVEKKAKKKAIKQLRKDPGGRAAYDSTKRIAKQLGKDVDVDIDDLGRVTRMYTK